MTDIEIISLFDPKYLPGLYQGTLIPHGPFLEEWKICEEFNNVAFISNYGRVKSIEGLIYKDYPYKEYRRLSLVRVNKNKYYFIHRLVAKYFLPNPENKPIINHKRAFRNDNVFTQIEWCTYAENNMHTARVIKREFANSECGKYKFLPATKYIGTDLITCNKVVFMGRVGGKKLGYDTGLIRMCINGQRSEYKGMTWEKERLPSTKRFIKVA